MDARKTLASRAFDFEDQERFAAISGDRNPLHLDPVLARRTQAGAPVVHGVHLLLWALEVLAASLDRPLPLRRLRVQFSAFVYLAEIVALRRIDESEKVARLELYVQDTLVSRVVAELGESNGKSSLEGVLPLIAQPREPLEPAFESMARCSGQLRFVAPPETVAGHFPQAARWLGAERLAALCASTNIVGMIVPGLHSVYAGLSVTAREPASEDGLKFRVSATDARFRLVRTSIEGGGFAGTIESFGRVEPTAQPSVASLGRLVAAHEFAGSTALIVGGSRGIGELTAKLIAAGGGRTILTYHIGKSDAERVAREIAAAGGVCDVLAYDARLPAAPQLEQLAQLPTHLYYFATPQIVRRQRDAYSRQRLDEFLAFYVDGFRDLVGASCARRTALSAFYPSSVFVAGERARGMAEYAMAKAAGEVLCRELETVHESLHVTVERLPRVSTDQTASIVPLDTASSLETMLPVVREVQSWPR